MTSASSNKPDILLTVAICTRNGSQKLPVVFSALLRQEGVDPGEWEILLIDNGSSDNTQFVFEEFQKTNPVPVMRCIFEPVPGQGAARSRAIRESSGAWICFVDDDNILAPRYLAEGLKFAQSADGIGAFGGRSACSHPEMQGGPLLAFAPFHAVWDAGDDPREIHLNRAFTAGLFVRTAAALPLVEEPWLMPGRSPGWPYGGEDKELCIKLVRRGWKIWYLPGLSFDHRIDRNRLFFARAFLHTLRLGGEDTMLKLAYDNSGSAGPLRILALAFMRFGFHLLQAFPFWTQRGRIEFGRAVFDAGCLLYFPFAWLHARRFIRRHTATPRIHNPILSFFLAGTLLLGLFGFSLHAAGGITPGTGSDMWIGFNGHPFTQAPYKDAGLNAQLELLKASGARAYRFDLTFNHAEAGTWNDFCKTLNDSGIMPLPVLIPPGRREKSIRLSVIENSCFAYAYRIVSKMKGQVTYWDLENELDGWAILHKGDLLPDGGTYMWNPPAGNRPDDYENSRYRFSLAILRGLSAGVRAADPNAKTVMNTAGWLHYGFIDRLLKDGVTFDVLSWHWYSEMGDIDKVRGGQLLAKLKSYGKPIWITEGNRRGGAAPGREKEQAEYLQEAVQNLKKNCPEIGLYCVYELLDEPQLGEDNPESYYGLVTVNADSMGKWTADRRKPAFSIIQAETGAGKNKP